MNRTQRERKIKSVFILIHFFSNIKIRRVPSKIRARGKIAKVVRRERRAESAGESHNPLRIFYFFWIFSALLLLYLVSSFPLTDKNII